MQRLTNPRGYALIVLLFFSLAGLGFALYDLLAPASGTTGTAGAILVTVSTALMVIAAAVLMFVSLPKWLSWLFLVLLLIDAVATAASGYFLMSDYLVATMLGALVAGLLAAGVGRKQKQVSA